MTKTLWGNLLVFVNQFYVGNLVNTASSRQDGVITLWSSGPDMNRRPMDSSFKTLDLFPELHIISLDQVQ